MGDRALVGITGMLGFPFPSYQLPTSSIRQSGPHSVTRARVSTVVGIAEAATQAYADDGVPILRATNIREREIVGELLYLDPGFANAPERKAKRIHSRDLVTVRTGNPGVTAVIPKELDDCHCFTMLITTLKQGNSPRFIEYCISSDYCKTYFATEGWGSAQINISVPILQNLPVAIPPADEQKKIVAYLDEETTRTNRVLERLKVTIDLLKEYRSSLITAAVSGQIDVSKFSNGAKANAPL